MPREGKDELPASGRLEAAQSTRWGAVSKLLDEALERPKEEREAFVRHMSGDDAELREEALQLLSACDRPDPRVEFLDKPASEHFAGLVSSEPAAAEQSGLPDLSGYMVDDRYRLTRRIGRGGMAEVYVAEDLRHHRQVAIKILYPDRATTFGVDRFLREIMLAARLGHPHIVAVFDSGAIFDRPYYVMPYVPGATLRERLQRQKTLPVDEVLAIAGNVAEALDHAHAAGIVHRDIKPENILLGQGHALVADFGVARAFAMAGDRRRASTSLVMGTPLYMSPEQAWHDPAIDGRSDVYSLACVVFEMLAGRPPFTGETASIVIGKQRAAAPPSLAEARPDAMSLDPVLQKALAKAPSDRFATAGEFVHALHAARAQHRRRVMVRLGLTTLAAFVAVVAIVAWQAARQWGGQGMLRSSRLVAERRATADTTLYLLLPFVYDSAATPRIDERHRLGDALRHWRDVGVVDEMRVDDVLRQRGGTGLGMPDARAIAESVRAGRLIWGDARRIGKEIRLHAVLYDVPGDSVIREQVVRLPGDLQRVDRALDDLMDRLLFPAVTFGHRDLGRGASTSLLATQSFRAGVAAITEWNLARADSMLTLATSADPDFALGQLWLALVRSWTRQPLASWQSPARLASTGQSRLAEHERLLADAVLASSRDVADWACPKWERLVARDANDFAAWYGLATCLRRDTIVVPDRSSISGWRFRSSYSRMLTAYRRAYELWPSIHRGLRSQSFAEMRELFVTSRGVLRAGAALPPSTLSFHGYAAWDDSLLFVPFPVNASTSGSTVTRLASADEAIKHQRALFHDVATSWVTRYPTSAAAVEALALSLEMLGDPAALDTLHRARLLATTSADRMRIAVQEVWVRVKFGVPDDTAALRRARVLADSLLDASPDSTSLEPGLVASLAALTGRTNRAARLSRQEALASGRLTEAAIARPAFELLAFALLGGSADTLRALEQKVDAAIDEIIASPEQVRARLVWLGRPSTLAFPDHRFPALPKLVGLGYPLLDAQAMAARGDTTQAIDALMRMSAARVSVKPSDLSVDALYPEAALLDELGHTRAASERLDPTLRALSASPPQMFADVVHAGALVRAMALRAELAEREGELATSRVWARAVETLWSSCDPPVAHVLRRMRGLARR